MIPALLSLATRLWGCSPEFERVGEPEANASPTSGGGPAEDEQDVGGVDFYTDVQRDSEKLPSVTDIGNPDNDEEKPEEVTPPPPPPPDPPPRNQSPTFGGIISPRDRAFAVVPESDSVYYKFSFGCTDDDGDQVRGYARILKDEIEIVNSTNPSPYVFGHRADVSVWEERIPPLSQLCWEPVACEDSRGGKTTIENQRACFETIDESVVHYWPFDSLGRNQVSDRSKNGKTGVLQGPGGPNGLPSLMAGVDGRRSAIKCDGIDDYIQTADAKAVGIANVWTLSWWQWLNRTDRTQAVVAIGNPQELVNGNQPNYIDAIASCDGETNDCRKLALNYIDSIGGSIGTQSRESVLNRGTWQHIAISHRGGNQIDSINLYVDGRVRDWNEAVNHDISGQQDSRRFIGLCRGLAGASPRPTEGRIDEFVIRNRAMGLQEIREECARNAPAGNTCGR